MSQTVVLSYQNLHGFFRLSRIPGTPELQTSLMLNLKIYHGISPHVKRNPLQPLAILWSVAAGASRCSQPGDSADMGRWKWWTDHAMSAPENGGYPYVMLFGHVIGKMTMIFWHKPKYCIILWYWGCPNGRTDPKCPVHVDSPTPCLIILVTINPMNIMVLKVSW